MEENKNVRECPVCKGKGAIKFSTLFHFSNKPCTMCKGSGTIPDLSAVLHSYFKNETYVDRFHNALLVEFTKAAMAAYIQAHPGMLSSTVAEKSVHVAKLTLQELNKEFNGSAENK